MKTLSKLTLASILAASGSVFAGGVDVGCCSNVQFGVGYGTSDLSLKVHNDGNGSVVTGYGVDEVSPLPYIALPFVVSMEQTSLDNIAIIPPFTQRYFRSDNQLWVFEGTNQDSKNVGFVNVEGLVNVASTRWITVSAGADARFYTGDTTVSRPVSPADCKVAYGTNLNRKEGQNAVVCDYIYEIEPLNPLTESQGFDNLDVLTLRNPFGLKAKKLKVSPKYAVQLQAKFSSPPYWGLQLFGQVGVGNETANFELTNADGTAKLSNKINYLLTSLQAGLQWNIGSYSPKMGNWYISGSYISDHRSADGAGTDIYDNNNNGWMAKIGYVGF